MHFAFGCGHKIFKALDITCYFPMPYMESPQHSNTFISNVLMNEVLMERQMD